MKKNPVNPLTFLMCSYAFLISLIALSGYILNYFNFHIDVLNIFIIVLITASLIYIIYPIVVSQHFTKKSLLLIAVSLLASMKYAVFFISKVPIGSSVDIAHYYFASDWISTYANLAFFDYTNEPNYYYLWHTWPLWLWYYGFEFVSVFISNVFDITIISSMQLVVGMSAFVSILCTGLIGYKVLQDYRAGILSILQLAAMPATFLLAFDGFYANITALSIGLVLAYISIDRVKLNQLPIIFVLIAGGFLIHQHTLMFMLGTILIYKILSYSQQYKSEFIGYNFTAGLSFITAYLLNPLVFNKILFEGTTKIIIQNLLINEPFYGFENLLGSIVFFVIGIIGIYILHTNRLKTKLYLYPIIWLIVFGGAFIFFIVSEKDHWANRMGYFVVYPLAISCSALYIKLSENASIAFKIKKINHNNVLIILISIALLLTSAYLGGNRADLNPAFYEAGMKIRGIDSNATIAYLQYPEPNPNYIRYFISAYSKHRIAWPIEKPYNITYENLRNLTYTNEQRIGLRYENFDTPKYYLIMFANSNKNYTYFLFNAYHQQNVTCTNIITNIKANNCSIYMDFINDDSAMAIAGFSGYESGIGRWTSNVSRILIPTIEQKGGILYLSAGAFRPIEAGEARVDVFLNNVLIGNFTAGNEFMINTFRINSNMTTRPFSIITFKSTTWIPDKWVGNGDQREIGIRFSSIEYISD